MHVRLGETTVLTNDFRSTDTVRFPTSLDSLGKNFFDCTRVLDAADVNFRGHRIRGTEVYAADTAQAFIKVLSKCDVPDAVQLYLVFA